MKVMITNCACFMLFFFAPHAMYGQAIQAGKSRLTFFDEYGIPHAVVKIEKSDGSTYWYGFKPVRQLAPVSKGYVDRSDRSNEVKNYVVFLIDDSMINQIEQVIAEKYEDATYILFNKDCVSFVADVARACCLDTRRINFLPGRFVSYETRNNNYFESGKYIR